MQTVTDRDDMLKERFDRVDEKFGRVNERFDEVNRRIREGREDAGQRFDRIEGDVVELKKGLAAIQATLTRISIGLAIAFAAVLVKGG